VKKGWKGRKENLGVGNTNNQRTCRKERNGCVQKVCVNWLTKGIAANQGRKVWGGKNNIKKTLKMGYCETGLYGLKLADSNSITEKRKGENQGSS